MPTIPVLPPLDGSLLFHELINFHLYNNPALPIFVYADDQASGHPTAEITFLEFGRAAHRIAHALRPRRAGDEGQVVMLIANCDTILYHATVAGMAIAGLVPFLVSHRNSAPAVVNMMKKTDCSRIVSLNHAHNALLDSVREEIASPKLVIDELPTLSHVFPKLGCEVKADPFVPYPAAVTRPDLASPAICFHSSGSTGFPKSIVHSHRIQISYRSQPFVRSFANIPISSRIGVMGLPPFHGYGTMAQLYLPITHLVTSVVYAPRTGADPHAAPVVPTTDNMLNCARWTRCKGLMTVPTFLEQWVLSEEDVGELKKMEFVLYAGGPLSDRVGDDLCAAGVPVTTCYGGTEFGCPSFVRMKEDILKDGDWNWMRFPDDINVRWVPYVDDTYECQILFSANHTVVVENLPDTNGYATSDLWIKHPTKDLWKIVGRTDDVITLASGEKTVPAPIESIINSSPLVQGTLMFGRERNQVGIIVEPRPEHVVNVQDDNAVAKFRNEIWPLVEEANKVTPAFSRIFKEMILIATPEKPVLRTPKGSIQQKATFQAYAAEIDALYNAAETTSQLNGFTGPSTWTVMALESWLMELANTVNLGHNINTGMDLFAQGFDSLSATYLRNKLITALRTSSDPRARGAVSRISPNFIFDNPTIEHLAARVATLVSEGGASQDQDLKQQHVMTINAMIDKYSHGLSEPRASVHGIDENGTVQTRSVVLITGTTGYLGSFLLAQLIKNPEVERVYALNRPSSTSSAERQSLAFIDKGLSLDLLKYDKLVYIEADASQDKCGLSPALYEELLGAVTIIIHNAWRLDFNLSLTSFESNIKATRNLVDLGLDSDYSSSLRFVFTSSVGSAQSWDHKKGAFPEEIQFDSSLAVGAGYGEAKYVCERIIVTSGLRATSLRIGKIAGGPNGSWATTDFVPIIVKSSITLGAFPDSRGVVSWMCAEEVAASVLDVAFADEAPQALNIVNPQRPSWTMIMSSIRDAVLKQTSVSLASDQPLMIPFVDWVVQLEKKSENATSKDLVEIPAIKLLEFFRAIVRHEEAICGEVQLNGSTQAPWEAGGLVDFSTAKAQRVSKSVAQMKPVGETDAHAWVNYWYSVGFLGSPNCSTC